MVLGRGEKFFLSLGYLNLNFVKDHFLVEHGLRVAVRETARENDRMYEFALHYLHNILIRCIVFKRERVVAAFEDLEELKLLLRKAWRGRRRAVRCR